jgi:hypothetical protein
MGTSPVFNSADGAGAGRARGLLEGADCADAAGMKSEICKAAMKNSAVAHAGLMKPPFGDVEIAANEYGNLQWRGGMCAKALVWAATFFQVLR